MDDTIRWWSEWSSGIDWTALLTWAFVVFISWGTFLTVAIVGKAREPLSGNVAAFTVVINLVLIGLLLHYLGVL